MLIAAYIAECGLDAGEQSAVNFIDIITTDTSEGFPIFGDSDERYKLKGGNKMIIEGLTDRLKQQIKTGHKLISIRSKSNYYDLVFEHGATISADFVVLATPLSILKEIELAIEGISSENLNCIQQIGFAQNNKLILGFNGRPWRENGHTSAGYVFNEAIQNGWDSGHMQNNNQGPSGYTVYLGGTPSLELSKAGKGIGKEDRVTDALVQKYLLQLAEIYPGAKNKFTNTHRAALWSNNPFAKGSYLCYKVGQLTTLRQHIPDRIGNVYFAGEHGSKNFQGYMNGGAESGRRTAEVLIKKLKTNA